MASLLLLSRDRRLRRWLAETLGPRGHHVQSVATESSAVEEVVQARVHALVVDDAEHQVDGAALVERLRGWAGLPVIVLQRESDVAQRVAVLDAGADDAVASSADDEELRARLEAVCRRAEDGRVPRRRLRAGEVCIDLAGRTIDLGDRQVELTPTEWDVVAALISRPAQIWPHDELIRTVWTPDHGDESRDVLRAHVRSLRRKLGDDAARPTFIRTVAGVGYSWIAELDPEEIAERPA